ncbi:MAG: L-2-hydroxyglutarate oxidase [Flavobacteriaceae bacterium]|nr:L-2-hydroxyglutarate oxidase [Flavobacteriaceae bacterium]
MLKKVAIIGGGILGLAIGYELSSQNDKYKVVIIEKENVLGKHQSGNNSGVLHCGLYYQPGSLKAKLAVEGIREMVKFSKNHGISHDICGKIVVATNSSEEKYLDSLANRGKKNGLKGLKFLSKTELSLREPNVKATKALLVPEEGIIDYSRVVDKLADCIRLNNGEIVLDCEVLSSKKIKKNQVTLVTNKFEKNYDLVISCSGLYSDRVFSKLIHKKSPLQIIPFRGEYMHVKKQYMDIVNHLVYPVPDSKFPFLGIHFTRLINGGREVGPNAVLALKREGYSNKDFSLNDTIEILKYKGLRNFILKNFGFTINEFVSSFSTKAFIQKAKKLIPSSERYMFEKGGTAGVRAQAISKSGELLMDFNILREKNQIHVLNAPSPGATASLSIAKHIISNYI